MTPDSAPGDSSRATPDELEQAWRAKQGPDVAKLYKFRVIQLGLVRFVPMCSSHTGSRRARWGCWTDAAWKVASSPYSLTGVRYYCDAHCPQVPEGRP